MYRCIQKIWDFRILLNIWENTNKKECSWTWKTGLFLQPNFGMKSGNIFGEAITDQQIDEAFNRFLVGIPEQKLTLLRQLHKSYRLFMLSNTNPIMFESRIPELFRIQGINIPDYFDKLYLSYQLGVTKPSPKIFEKIIADSGILPQETLFLDDSQKNIDAARKFGFQTYLVAPREDFSFIFDL